MMTLRKNSVWSFVVAACVSASPLSGTTVAQVGFPGGGGQVNQGSQSSQGPVAGPQDNGQGNPNSFRSIADQNPAGAPVQNSGAGLGPVLGNNQQPPQLKELPCPFEPLDQRHLEYLDQLLGYWETSTKQISQFECKFDRWKYDPVFGPTPDPMTGKRRALEIARGEIRFEDPDKAMYEVREKWFFTQNPGKEPEYQMPEVEGKVDEARVREKWIADGDFNFEFKFSEKMLLKHQLPPEMKGKTIADGPLPFIFGADAAKMKERYWIRVTTPDGSQDEYWLEAYPKDPVDRGNFSKVTVILAKQDFLPVAVEIFDANSEANNPKSEVYVFNERQIKTKADKGAGLFARFTKKFYDVDIPGGWQLVEQDWTKPQTLEANRGNVDQGIAPAANNPTVPR